MFQKIPQIDEGHTEIKFFTERALSEIFVPEGHTTSVIFDPTGKGYISMSLGAEFEPAACQQHTFYLRPVIHVFDVRVP